MPLYGQIFHPCGIKYLLYAKSLVWSWRRIGPIIKDGGTNKSWPKCLIWVWDLNVLVRPFFVLANPPFLSRYSRSPMIYLSSLTTSHPTSLPRRLDLVNPNFLGAWLGPLPLPLPLLISAFSAASSAPLAIRFLCIWTLSGCTPDRQLHLRRPCRRWHSPWTLPSYPPKLPPDR